MARVAVGAGVLQEPSMPLDGARRLFTFEPGSPLTRHASLVRSRTPIPVARPVDGNAT
jgi:hypothetical protein